MRPPDETTALVTGATDGLGRSVATELANRGARVLVHGARSRARRGGRGARSASATGNERVELLPRRLRLARRGARARRDGGRRGARSSSCWSTTPASAAGCPTAASARRAATASSSASRSTTWPGSCSPRACSAAAAAQRARPGGPGLVARAGGDRLRRPDADRRLRRHARLLPVEARPGHPRDRSRRVDPGRRADRQQPAPRDLHADQDRALRARRRARHARARDPGDASARARPGARRGQRPLLRPARGGHRPPAGLRRLGARAAAGAEPRAERGLRRWPSH